MKKNSLVIVARKILSSIGMPEKQQNDMCCYCLLALLQITPKSTWNQARNDWTRIHDIINFLSEHYNVKYAENSRETIRKQALHRFRDAAVIEDNGKATNSPNYMYRISNEALALIKTFSSDGWDHSLQTFHTNHGELISKYASRKKLEMHSVEINGSLFKLSPGKHNLLQKKIIEEFAPRFAANCICLYLGDTTKKDLFKNISKLEKLGIKLTTHGKMPDIILLREDKKWIYLIEAVTSVGPMSPQRLVEIKEMLGSNGYGKIFVTAFLDFKTYKKFSGQIAWETEIWIADMPDHMIHMNGDKFLGPRG